ncbi:RagB/SusD family nutrient uptake outer membrane protein [Sphingobacterium alkalisoli]|uniref:RagB/SusD family nutrient uptake outer membrane protein n=1 Tax=Sphingobacterium alkalisoli TaxID=1874115 RepID=A0A4U0GVW0_9SPHI|nr:RagB/SusD family nutrient uptake outer membrane protein [Sphingobacterium alkalisoli]TJY62734.1 RagB/SusD family nutrient uptake outer membrane protein [Sphingobacterium alkalisoli]
MKTIKNIVIMGLLSILSLSGCKKFLDLAPISQTNGNNFYQTAEDMKNALNAVYGALQYPGMYYSSMHIIGDLRSDNTWIPNPNAGANLQEVDEFKNNAFNSISSTTWSAHYQGIQAANIVIDKIDAVNMDEDLKNQYRGEAKFLRALMYFNMVRIFGDVPLVLEVINNPQEGYAYGRTPAEEVYAQIVSDLSDAEGALLYEYGNADIGRATKGAAMSLLGKVYLTQKKWALAVQKLKEVIDQTTLNKYQLLPSYASVFGIANENSKESIFEVQFKKGSSGEGSPFTNQFAPIGSGTAVTSLGNPLGQNIPTDNMNAAYEVDDVRKDLSMRTSYVVNGNTVMHNYVAKYLGVPAANLDSDNNWIVLRFADVLLMYAEALNEQGYVADGPAFAYLNQIRNRANLLSKTSNHVTPALRIADQGAFRLAIEHERRVELAFEGHRWFDLVRTDRAMAVLESIGMQAHHVLFPIPNSQIEINPGVMTQNQDYD